MKSSYKTLLLFFLVLASLKLCGQPVQRKVAFPNLVGLTLREAKIVLKKNKVDIGAIIYNPVSKDFDTLVVYKQNPPNTNDKGNTNYLKKYNLIDLWLVNSYINLDNLKKPKTRVVVRHSSNK